MKSQSIHAVTAHGSFGTEVPRPLGSLFRQEGTFVLLARENCPAKLKTAFNRANGLRNSSVGEPLKG